jgi:DNA repair and recombination protein RAD54B
MGLGKTLQVLALLWTLLRQSPSGGPQAPVARKCVVVAPSTLVSNWGDEVRKWLGIERVQVREDGGREERRGRDTSTLPF